ncbi:unnamed protein product [Mortierella alpina]
MAIASSVSAQDVAQAEASVAPEAAAPEAPESAVDMAPTLTSEGQDAMWFKHKKHHKHGRHGKHGKNGKGKCCIKYVTITSVPECKPEPTVCAKAQAESEAAVVFDPVEAPAPTPVPGLV